MLSAAPRKKTVPDLIALVIARAEVANGRPVQQPAGSANMLAGVKTKGRKARSVEWSHEEEEFLKKNLGYMTDKEIGDALGRTEIAVHLHWSRDLHLPSPSKNPNVLTANQAAEMIGIDGHKVAHWVDRGLIAGRLVAGGRKIRLIRRVTFFVWVCSPSNWVYFDIRKVKDAHLKRLLKLRAKRWGDEWWSARKAADYHGVTSKDITRQAKLGRIKSFHLPVSLGGRHADRKWSNHYFLKSDVVKLELCFGKGYGRKNQKYQKKFTPAADAWLLKARDELGMSFVHIGRTMKIGKEKIGPTGGRSNPVIGYRYKTLKANKRKAK